MSQVKKEFGLRLSYLRKKMQITQDELADQLGVSRNTISGIECGRQSPKFDNLEKLAEALGVTISQLFEGM